MHYILLILLLVSATEASAINWRVTISKSSNDPAPEVITLPDNSDNMTVYNQDGITCTMGVGTLSNEGGDTEGMRLLWCDIGGAYTSFIGASCRSRRIELNGVKLTNTTSDGKTLFLVSKDPNIKGRIITLECGGRFLGDRY